MWFDYPISQKENNNADTVIDHWFARRCSATGSTRTTVEGTWSGCSHVRAARLPRLDRGARHNRHIDRARTALDWEDQPNVNQAHTGADTSDDGRHGRRTI